MSQTPFRSVGQQRRTEATNVKRSAPDRTRQTNELARQQQLQFDNLQTVIGIDQKLQLSNRLVLSDAELRNQQLVMAQLSDNLQFSQEARKLRQAQGLEDQKMLDDFDRQILNLRNAEQVTANDIKLQQAKTQSDSITAFGESLLTFSGTLAKKRIEEQNKANRQLQAKGQFDALMRRAGNPETNLNQAQDARAAIGTDLNLKANELESQGLDNDATQLRSSNAFYRFGFQEGLALKAANGFQGSLDQAIAEFIENGQLYGSKDALVKVQQFIRNFSIDYIDKNGLQALPEEILSAYFSRPMLVAQSKAVGKFNEVNNKVTKDLAVGTGINKLMTYVTSTNDSSVNPAQFQTTVTKEALAIIAADPTNAKANLKRLYNSIYNDTRYSEDPSKSSTVDRFISALSQDPNLLPYVDPIVSQFQEDEYKRDQRIEKQAEKAEKDAADEFLNNTFRAAEGITSAEGMSRLRQEAFQSPEYLNATSDQQMRMRDKLLDLKVSDSLSIQIQNDAFEATNPTAAERRQYAEDNRGFGTDFYNEQMAQADKQDKVIKQYDSTLTSYKARILNIEPMIASGTKIYPPGVKEKYRELVKVRQAELASRFKDWYQSQSDVPDPEQVDKFFERQNDLYEKVEQKDLESYLNDKVVGDGTSITGAAGAAQINVNGQKRFNYTDTVLREKAQGGTLGTLDPTEGIFLSKGEVVSLTAAYEKDGTVAPLLQNLIDNSNTSVEEFLEGQAELYGMPGSVVKPGRQFRGVWNKTTSVRTYYSNKGYSKNASIAFQAVANLYDFDKEEIYPLDGNALKPYNDFADANKLNKKDPNTRMDFLDTIVRRYQNLGNGRNKAYQVLNSANPTVDDLVEAMNLIFGWNATDKEAYRQQLNQSL
jgi:hypothetical protein